MSTEPSSPVQKLWKPELYKIQLEAPTPKPLHRLTVELPNSEKQPAYYGSEYFGTMGHQLAENLLQKKLDGTYLVRRSPAAQDFHTLSMCFRNFIKHFKIYYKEGEGHYLQNQMKLYDSLHDLVADGLVNFYMQLHAAPILQQINEQTRNCYQQSPYMTLNRRKLRALSNELRRSIVTKERAIEAKHQHGGAAGEELANMQINDEKVQNNNNANEQSTKGTTTTTTAATDDGDVDAVLPLIYEKSHNFKLHTFKGLNWCEFCANFLWGFTAQGVKCEACGFVAHSKCSELVPAKCVPDMKRIRGVFGTDLTTMVQLYQCSIPFVVRRCAEEVEARGMLQEGIYRVSGFADEIDALKLALDREGEKTDMSEAAYGNVNVIAGTLKLYLRLLPVPLITYQAYPSFMQAARTASTIDQIKNMKDAAKKLPIAHYNCLKFMMEHLKRVASHYAANKMNEHNLATVFAPTLIATPQHMINLTEEIFMLSSLIINCEAIFN